MSEKATQAATPDGNETLDLAPSERVARCMLSTPALFRGSFTSEHLDIQHAWSGRGDHPSIDPWAGAGPLSRTTLVASFPTLPHDRRVGAVLPDYTGIGDFLVVCLGVFFGKRFDNHGIFEGSGMFARPVFHSLLEPLEHDTPQCESKPRVDLGIELNLSLLSYIRPVLEGYQNDALRTFQRAGTFYVSALQEVDRHPDKAYLDLVTAGEILGEYFDFEDAVLFDKQTRDLLEEIRATLPRGESKSRLIRRRLVQVKRRFVLGLLRLLNANFFTVNEAEKGWRNLDSETLERRLRAAYDLRSQRVHAGHQFGHWVVSPGRRAERQYGKPVVQKKTYRKALGDAPTFTGLERVLRYALVAFLHRYVCPFDERLAPDADVT